MARSAAAAALLLALLSAGPAGAGDFRLPFPRYRLPDVDEVQAAGEDAEPDIVVASGAQGGTEESGTAEKVVGGIMFGSGVLLCSWGIVDWQTSESQCCPAHNTENVAKIVVGVVLINAGLVYLIAGGL